jgi:TonB family protein
MKKLFTGSALALLLSLPAAVSAQTTPPPSPTYSDPHYPGGPDSLRALVYRSTRLTATNSKSLAVLQMELKDGTTPTSFKTIGTAARPKSATGQATRAAFDYLQAHMAAWEPGAPTAQARPGKMSTFLLPLLFARPASDQPYAYADQEPVFPYLDNSRQNQRPPAFDNNPDGAAIFARLTASYNGNLTDYLQRQTRYPAEALRNREQGRVLVYFEVAENGTIENAEVLESAGGALDAEVRRAVRSLQPAATPALLQGRPVRVFYVVPVNFKMV